MRAVAPCGLWKTEKKCIKAGITRLKPEGCLLLNSSRNPAQPSFLPLVLDCFGAGNTVFRSRGIPQESTGHIDPGFASGTGSRASDSS
jgi:hypothetical protein